MKNIKFLGASGMVTGSCYVLTDQDGQGIMIDMGIFQGLDNVNELNYSLPQTDFTKLDGVVLTHAHLDHCGRLPLLIKAGFNKKIYMTEATRILTELALLDSAKIAKEDSKDPLFSEIDVLKVLSRTEIIAYDQEFEIGNFRVIFRDAGHILGSASIEILSKLDGNPSRKIVFSGDLGNSPEEIVRPTQMIKEAEVVVMESTYGDRTHSLEDPSAVFEEEINTIEKNGGTLLVPAFSMERTQEILHRLDHLKHKNKIREDLAVFLDSPLAIKTTNVYEEFRDLFNKEMSEHTKQDDPFIFPGLVAVESSKQSNKIHKIPGPKVIIAGSGMMTGGRILNHAIYYLPQETTRLLIVGYQAEGTLGRNLLDGAQRVRIFGQSVEVKASLRKSSAMSAHADQPKLMKWLGNIQGVKTVFLTHGENISRQVLGRLIEERHNIKNINLPVLNQEFVLD